MIFFILEKNIYLISGIKRGFIRLFNEIFKKYTYFMVKSSKLVKIDHVSKKHRLFDDRCSRLMHY